MDIPENEIVKDPIEYILQLAHSILPINKWGFKESYRSSKEIILNSEWCRINFVWSGWDMYGGNTISMYYGRHHAPNDSTRMTWSGAECHCWHREELALHFLDGHTPENAATMISSHPTIQKYRQSELGQSLSNTRRQPEWLIHLQVEIWEQYAPELFEVFDLRRPGLWNRYQKFIKEIYDIKGRSPNIHPPLDQVC
jgi:hypothetical protein